MVKIHQMHISYKCCLSLKHFSYMKKNVNFDFMYCTVYIFSISMQLTKYKIQKASQHEVEQLDLYFIHSVSLFLLEINTLLHKCKQNVRKLQCQLLLTTRNKASLMLWAEPFFFNWGGGCNIFCLEFIFSVHCSQAQRVNVALGGGMAPHPTTVDPPMPPACRSLWKKDQCFQMLQNKQLLKRLHMKSRQHQRV